jgi:hypothetical protein
MGADFTPWLAAETPGEHSAEDADLAQRAELARRLEAAIEKLEAIRAELENLVFPIESGP